MEKVLKSYLEYICGKDNVTEDVPLSTKTTFRIGGPARFFVIVPTKQSLVRLISTLKYVEYKYFIIGVGANILVSDEGFDGVVIKLGFSQIVDNQCFVYADAGASLSKVCTFARQQNLTGLEWACGIPATIGGAVYMNAGAHGGQMSDVITMVDVLIDGEIKTMENRQLRFAYRKSIFHSKKDWVILGTYLYLKKSNKQQIEDLENKYISYRKQTQPTEHSAGSVFRKPNESFAVGKAIDELGLKGTQIGGACISTKHAGFIVNMGNATAKDVINLMKLVRKQVYNKHQIKLKKEILYLDNSFKNKKTPYL